MYETSKGGKRITPSQAVDLINNKDAIFVDTREKENFDTGPVSYTHLTLPTNREV